MPPRPATVSLPNGEQLPLLGQGTWQIGDDPARRDAQLAALRLGIDLGLTLIDTAEMYGDGRSELLVGEAIAGRRDGVFLVSKVLPSNATKRGTIRACERSLARLATDRIDLYLLHWRGRTQLAETLAGFEELQQAGKIRYWGVSNFDINDMDELLSDARGRACASNQLLYNLSRRGIELDLLPWCRARKMPIMAYAPIEQGRLLGEPVLQVIARRHGATAAQVALAWLVHRGDVIAIPKAGRAEHVLENRAALDLTLCEDDLADLDHAFPRPSRPVPLDML